LIEHKFIPINHVWVVVENPALFPRLSSQLWPSCIYQDLIQFINTVNEMPLDIFPKNGFAAASEDRN
jgi:hypothetical protein